MIRRPPRSTLSSSSAASDVYKRQVLEYSFPSQAYFNSVGYFQITISPRSSAEQYFEGELHRFCESLKAFAGAHNATEDHTISMDDRNLPYVCAVRDRSPHGNCDSPSEMAKWVGFYEAFRAPADSWAPGEALSPLKSSWPDSLIESYTDHNVLMHRGEQLLIGETSLYLRASRKDSAKWLGSVIYVKTMVHAFCMIKVEMDRIFRLAHHVEESQDSRRVLRDRVRQLKSEMPVAQALVDVVGRLTGEYEWSQLLNCDIQNKRVVKRAATVFQVDLVSQIVNKKMHTLVSELKDAQKAAKHILTAQQKDQLQLLTLLSKINVIIAVAKGTNLSLIHISEPTRPY
eukprot:TRINITY_DN23038_c0_g1_i1.p1 TRINITY_DN23038_c0_g1~~TRINITY_DN23038_c0_g1_i1.p1  ORF type:complete len:344 (+),score=76.33 TRINITY_DN23038_c0_g1_i1:103-1134(+)